MRRLTPKEEIFIIKDLIQNGWPMDNGAARSVYEPTEAIQERFQLDDDCCVIKVAMGLGGYNQTALEIAAYEHFGQKYPLAKIIAAGRFVEIMEKVFVVNECFRNYNDYCEESSELFLAANDAPFDFLRDDINALADERRRITTDDPEEYSLEELEGFLTEADYSVEYSAEGFREIFNTALTLEDLFGETGDNGQLGYAPDGRLVAYDYGFEADSEEVQTSRIAWKSNEFVNRYLLDLLKEYSANKDFDVFAFFDKWEFETEENVLSRVSSDMVEIEEDLSF